MPSKYYIRNFVANNFYHVYNRGAYKQITFRSTQDYLTFIDILDYYLNFPIGKPQSVLNRIQVPNLVSPPPTPPIELIAYCLMPNHFHLILKQNLDPTPATSITNLMRRLCVTFSMYAKLKNNHSGTLFESKYKSIHIENDSCLLYLTRYIHRNPLAFHRPKAPHANARLAKYPYSSYAAYLQPDRASPVNPNPVLEYFHSTHSDSFRNYQAFVVSNQPESKTLLGIRTLDP